MREEIKTCKHCGEYPILMTYETVYCLECDIEMDLLDWNNLNTRNKEEPCVKK